MDFDKQEEQKTDGGDLCECKQILINAKLKS